MTRSVAVVVNMSSGTMASRTSGISLEKLLNLVREQDVEIAETVIHEQGSSLSADCRSLLDLGIDQVLVAGGDGTVNCVASTLAMSSIILSVIPCGTFNLFARSLGISTDIPTAVKQAFESDTVQVDCGFMNGKIFLLDSALGLYPKFVWDFEQENDMSSLMSRLFSCLRVLKDFAPIQVTLEKPSGERFPITSPLVLIAPNTFVLKSLLPRRTFREPAGLLEVKTVTAADRASLVASFAQGVTNPEADIVDTTSEWFRSFTVHAENEILHVSLDGEVHQLPPPLHYECRSSCLIVTCPELTQTNTP